MVMRGQTKAFGIADLGSDEFRGFLGSKHVVMLLILLIGSLGLVEARVGNCSSVAPDTIERSAMLYNVTGPLITIHPLVNGVVIPDLYLKWHLDIFVERQKIRRTTSGGSLGNNYTHVSPTPPFSFNPLDRTDPLQPYVANVACLGKANLPCGPILKHIYSSELDCYTTHETITYHGSSRETIYVHFSHPDDPDFIFRAEHHVLDDDLVVPVNNTGIPAFLRYFKDALKLSYVWENYNWAGGDDIVFFNPRHNNASAFDFWSNLTASVPFACNGSIITDAYSRNISIIGEAQPLDILIEIATVYVADGYGFADPFTDLNLSVPFQSGLFISTQIRSSLNDGAVGHWHRMDYDPNFVSLLSSPVQPLGSPTSPANAKIGKLPTWAVALIAIACVLALVVVLVLLVVFVPSIKAAVYPFLKRGGYARTADRPSGSASSPSSASSNWNHGSKPPL